MDVSWDGAWLPLGNFFYHLHCKKLPYIHSNLTFFYLETIISCSIAVGPDKKSVLIFL